MIFNLNHKYLFLLVVVFLVLFFFPRELYFTPDSMVYLQSAESLVTEFQFKNFFKDIWSYNTHYPPLLSILIAFISLTGFSFTDAFLILQILNLVVCSLLVFEMTESFPIKTRFLASFSFILLFFQVFQMGWSEPLFLSFLAIILFFWKKWIETDKYEIIWVIGFAVLPLIRYAGLFFFPIFFLLYRLKKPFDKKFIINFLIISSPIILWLIRNILVSNSATNREFSFRMENYLVIWEGFITIRNFFFPFPIFSNDLTRVFIFIFTSGFLYFLFYTKSIFAKGNLFIAATYFAILSFSIFTMDKNTPMDFRILSPFIFLIFIYAIFIINQKYLNFVLFLHFISHLIALNLNWVPNHKNESVQMWAKKNHEVIQFINDHQHSNFIADEYSCNLLTYVLIRPIAYYKNETILANNPKGYLITKTDSVFVQNQQMNLKIINKNIAEYSLIK